MTDPNAAGGAERERYRVAYEAAGCDAWTDRREDEIEDIVSSLRDLEAAPTDEAAAALCEWWGCWRDDWTALDFVQRFRRALHPDAFPERVVLGDAHAAANRALLLTGMVTMLKFLLEPDCPRYRLVLERVRE